VGVESGGQEQPLSQIGKQVAMHVAAAAPLAVRKEELDPEVVERERAIFAEQARESGKPETIIDKMVEGRMRKYHEEVVLLEQAFVIDPELKVRAAIERLAERLGSSIVVTGFVRFALGEGMAPKPANLADEVAQLAGA